MKNYAVITTIYGRTPSIEKLSKIKDLNILLVGDKKTPHIEETEKIKYLSIDQQADLGYDINSKLPFNHYTRKNIGYLYALEQGADLIYDTDDDNAPDSTFYIPEFRSSNVVSSKDKFVNAYKYYSKENIWPRGYPLDKIHDSNELAIKQEPKNIGVWQGLVNNDPDVDAIFRLVSPMEVTFENNDPIVLSRNQYCPFNSQNTFWNKEVYLYMYLPATVTFRFTDILRGYIAQRLFWEHNLYLGFMSPNVIQERNEHNLMKDFESEIPVYMRSKEVVDTLDTISLSDNHSDNLFNIYKELEKIGIVEKEELEILEGWISDFNDITKD